jgi:hypothetical protein
VEAEFAHLGVDFHARGRSMNESIPVLAAALANEFVEGFGARPRPTQSPRPPIWVAGSSPSAISRAARLADGWLPQGPASQEMVDSLRTERDKHGRSGAFMVGHITPFLHIGSPTFEVGDATLTGTPVEIADKILAGTPRGVNQLQVRFKARSCNELCEQLEAFARDVAPLVTSI